MNKAERFLRMPEVENRTGLSRSTIYKRIQANAFPSPVDLGNNASAWLESEIEAWQTARIEARNQKEQTR